MNLFLNFNYKCSISKQNTRTSKTVYSVLLLVRPKESLNLSLRSVKREIGTKHNFILLDWLTNAQPSGTWPITLQSSGSEPCVCVQVDIWPFIGHRHNAKCFLYRPSIVCSMWGLWYTTDAVGGGYQNVMSFHVLAIDIFFTIYCGVTKLSSK